MSWAAFTDESHLDNRLYRKFIVKEAVQRVEWKIHWSHNQLSAWRWAPRWRRRGWGSGRRRWCWPGRDQWIEWNDGIISYLRLTIVNHNLSSKRCPRNGFLPNASQNLRSRLLLPYMMSINLLAHSSLSWAKYFLYFSSSPALLDAMIWPSCLMKNLLSELEGTAYFTNSVQIVTAVFWSQLALRLISIRHFWIKTVRYTIILSAGPCVLKFLKRIVALYKLIASSTMSTAAVDLLAGPAALPLRGSIGIPQAISAYSLQKLEW